MKSLSLLPRFNLQVILVTAFVVLAWAIALIGSFTGAGDFLNYHSLIHGNTSNLLERIFTLIFSWQVMIIAMMLPSNLPLIQLFVKVSRSQPQHLFYLSLLGLTGAYLSVWSGFAVVAFVMASLLHWFISSVSWLRESSWLISAITLFIAGVFQFSDLKQRCLKVCRHPLSFLHHHYQRGLLAAWNLGINHGLYCLGCCWALMLLMFITGIGHLVTMLILTGLMVIEKTATWGQTLVPIVGVGLMFLAVITVVNGVF